MDNLPGWNSITFEKLNIRGFFPWFTEYEKNPTRKRVIETINHPNSVNEIIGHEFLINERGYNFFRTILKVKPEGEVILSDGVFLKFTPYKSNKHDKVVLKAKSQKKIELFLNESEKAQLRKNRFLEIKNLCHINKMWNLKIIM